MSRPLPDRPAVSDDRSSRTYRELTERVARLAGGLRAQGLAPGNRVLLSLENCGEFLELLFGCWPRGCARCRRMLPGPRWRNMSPQPGQQVEFISPWATADVLPVVSLNSLRSLSVPSVRFYPLRRKNSRTANSAWSASL